MTGTQGKDAREIIRVAPEEAHEDLEDYEGLTDEGYFDGLTAGVMQDLAAAGLRVVDTSHTVSKPENYRATIEHDGGGPLSGPWVARIYRGNAYLPFLWNFSSSRRYMEWWARRQLRKLRAGDDKYQEVEIGE